MESTTPSPNNDYENSDNGSEHSSDMLDYYCIRITSHGKFTIEELLEWIKDESTFYEYVVGRENDTNNEHYHIVVSIDPSNGDEADVRGIIRWFLQQYWTLPNGKLPKGFGNKQYNCQQSHDKDRAISYAVKLGEFWYEGFSEEYINQRKAESFEKKKPSTFKLEYMTLCQQFQESDMDLREFMIKFCLLKSKYAQQVRMHDAYNFAISNLFLRDPGTATDYVENFLYKV